MFSRISSCLWRLNKGEKMVYLPAVQLFQATNSSTVESTPWWLMFMWLDERDWDSLEKQNGGRTERNAMLNVLAFLHSLRTKFWDMRRSSFIIAAVWMHWSPKEAQLWGFRGRNLDINGRIYRRRRWWVEPWELSVIYLNQINLLAFCYTVDKRDLQTFM